MTVPLRPVQKRILVVDDAAPMLTAMVMLLSLSGYQVEGEETAFGALDRFAPGQWDLVITDLEMPGMNGETLAAEIKRLDPQITVMLVTGYPTAVKSPDLFVTILVKPFTAPEMLSALGSVFSGISDCRSVGDSHGCVS